MRTYYSILTGLYVLTVACGATEILDVSRERLEQQFGLGRDLFVDEDATSAGMQVRHYLKQNWEVTIFYHREHAHRAVIAKVDKTPLAETEIQGLLATNKGYNPWEKYLGCPFKRAWFSAKKFGGRYAAVADTGQWISLATGWYVEKVNRDSWFQPVNLSRVQSEKRTPNQTRLDNRH